MAAAFPKENEEERICDVCTTAGNKHFSHLYKRIMRAVFVDGTGTLDGALTDMAARYRKEFDLWSLPRTPEKLGWRLQPFLRVGQWNESINQEQMRVAMQRQLGLRDIIVPVPNRNSKAMAAMTLYRRVLLHVAAAHADTKPNWISRISGIKPHAIRDNCYTPIQVVMLDPPSFKIRRPIEYRSYQQWPCYFAFPADTKVTDPVLTARAAEEEDRLQ